MEREADRSLGLTVVSDLKHGVGTWVGAWSGVPTHSPKNHSHGEAPIVFSSPPTMHVIRVSLHLEGARSVGVHSEPRASWMGNLEQGYCDQFI